jgi:amyloid beta precursor protein binding protein 1
MATEDKYDRQLRLWGPHGQRRLMESHMLLLNADAVGTETLKNLVLPGVGQFTVMDGKTVSKADMGCNFFVTEESMGKPRAEVVVELLCEMNEDVRGYAKVEDPTVAMQDPAKCKEYLRQFGIVLAANLTEDTVRAVAKACWELDIPFVNVRAYGMIGYMRIQARQHDIIESKPDARLWDLRIANSFKELDDFALTFNLDTLEPVDHKHVPFVVILCQVLMKWKREHGGGALPTWSDKTALTQAVEDLSNNYYPAQGFPDEESRVDFEKFRGINYEENFKEARKEVPKMWMPKKPSSEITELIAAAVASTAPPTEFCVCMRALGVFMDRFGGEMPLGGGIPDMFSSTQYYTALQGVFERKALSDKAAFAAIVKEQCTATGYTHPITDDSIELFVKNVFDIRSMRLRSIEEEFASPNAEEIGYYEEFPAKEQSPILWYLALRAVDRFQSRHKRWPGSCLEATTPEAEEGKLSDDADAVYKELTSLVAEIKPAGGNFGEDALNRKHAVEITRYGGAELHNIAAVIGGIASQEAVKVITHQYTPLNNTYIYNGIACAGASYSL